MSGKNGLNIKISQAEFMAKAPSEQNWMLFESVIEIQRGGCEWAKKTYGSSFWRKFYILGAAIGGSIIAGIMVLRYLFPGCL